MQPPPLPSPRGARVTGGLAQRLPPPPPPPPPGLGARCQPPPPPDPFDARPPTEPPPRSALMQELERALPRLPPAAEGLAGSDVDSELANPAEPVPFGASGGGAAPAAPRGEMMDELKETLRSRVVAL